MFKGFGHRRHKAGLSGLPCTLFDADLRMLYTDHIKSIGFASAAGRSGGAGLHYQHGVAVYFIARRAAARMTYVQVPGEKKVDAAAGKHFHRQPRVSDNLLILVAVG